MDDRRLADDAVRAVVEERVHAVAAEPERAVRTGEARVALTAHGERLVPKLVLEVTRSEKVLSLDPPEKLLPSERDCERLPDP